MPIRAMEPTIAAVVTVETVAVVIVEIIMRLLLLPVIHRVFCGDYLPL